MNCCPTCNRPFVDPAPAPDAVTALRAACQFRDIWVSHDGRVREADAATLMGLAAKTLRNRRCALDPNLPAHITRNRHPLYSLASLAEWLESA